MPRTKRPPSHSPQREAQQRLDRLGFEVLCVAPGRRGDTLEEAKRRAEAMAQKNPNRQYVIYQAVEIVS